MKQKYKVVFLDWNGTLSTSKFWGHWQESGNKYHKYWRSIESALFEQHQHLIDPWMRGEYESEQIVEILSPIVKLDEQTLLRELEESCRKMEFVSPEILEVVKQLRQSGVKVVVATDNMDTFPRWTVPSLRLLNLFDDVLESHSLKSLKIEADAVGQSKFFKNCFRRNRVDPTETVLIEDSSKKKAKIQAFGIDYIEVEYGGLMPAMKSLLK